MSERLSKLLFWCSLGAMVFAYGVAVGRYELPPYAVLRFGWQSVTQLVAEREMRLGTRPTEHLHPARHAGAGVTRVVPDRMAPGLTFLAGFFDEGTEMRLLQADGTVVHRWPVRLSQVFPSLEHVRPVTRIPQTDWHTEIHGAQVLRDGAVVFNFEGVGLASVDRCGSVRWTLPYRTHHSVERSRDGAFWVGGSRHVDGVSPVPPIPAPFDEETLLKVSADGQILEEISVPRLFVENGLEALLLVRVVRDAVVEVPGDDLTHLNDIEELARGGRAGTPPFAAGDLLVSIRSLSLVMVVDPATHVVKWHQTGPWISQHDPDVLPGGTVSVFSNNGDGTETGTVLGGSTVLEVDPATGVTRVRYGGREDQPLFTAFRGKHDNLENGNILISESNAGRVIEVTPAGETVWEFVNRYDDESVAVVNDVLRLPPGYFTVDDWTCANGVGP